MHENSGAKVYSLIFQTKSFPPLGQLQHLLVCLYRLSRRPALQAAQSGSLFFLRREMFSCFRPRTGATPEIARDRVVFTETDSRWQDGYLHESFQIYGREDDKNKIMGIMIDDRNRGNSSTVVIPITGIGGIGKTTLARYIYNDEKVKSHFSMRVWFCVTEVLHKEGLAAEIVRSSGRLALTQSDISVPDAVRGHKFLLVLDDVWEESAESLAQFLEGSLGAAAAAEGSVIIVTTRSEGVARRLGSSGIDVHHLEGLSSDDCWKLFKRKVFNNKRKETKELENIGREIVEKFQGVPLIALAMAGLLQFVDDRSEWSNICASEIWQLPKVASVTLSALNLSYEHLPPHLKKCFIYCSLFPKSWEIHSTKLVDLWLAEGLISPSPDNNLFLEDIGNSYCSDLQQRSFLQVEQSRHRKTTTYKIHDLFHDLALTIVGDKHKISRASSMEDIAKSCQRLTLICAGITKSISEDLYKLKKIETLHLLMEDHWIETMHKCSIEEVPSAMFTKLRYLRVLCLNSVNITELPGSINKLKFLRYLNLSETGIITVPNSIGELKSLNFLNLESCQKLQTLPQSINKLHKLAVLNLNSCKALENLPDGISNLHNLLHLKIDQCSLTYMPRGLGKLTNLQILSKFVIDEEKGSSLAELEHLDLSGELDIFGLHTLEIPTVAEKANISKKHQLKTLELFWDWFCFDNSLRDVLEMLKPHENLKKLRLSKYGHNEFPNWMNNSLQSALPNLVKITLDDMFFCESLPPLGELPSLKSLNLYTLASVKQIGEEIYGKAGTFPSLEVMKIGSLPALTDWSLAADGRKCFPHLHHLELVKCPQLEALPSLTSVNLLKMTADNGKLLSEESLCHVLLPSLKELHISKIKEEGLGCEKFESEGLRYLTSIQKLTIYDLEEPFLPEGIRHLIFLNILDIRFCRNLVALPEWLNFTSLQTLKIYFCPKMTQLPESVRRLSGLQSLDVKGTAELWKQYEIGPNDWKVECGITHVPNVLFEMYSDLTVDDPELEWDGALRH